MMLELRAPLPLITPKGEGWAYFLLDYGVDHHLMWVCFIKKTGECWVFSNPEIRVEANITTGMGCAE